MHIDKLADIINEYNNTCSITITLKHADVKSSTYINFVLENNDKRC